MLPTISRCPAIEPSQRPGGYPAGGLISAIGTPRWVIITGSRVAYAFEHGKACRLELRDRDRDPWAQLTMVTDHGQLVGCGCRSCKTNPMWLTAAADPSRLLSPSGVIGATAALCASRPPQRPGLLEAPAEHRRPLTCLEALSEQARQRLRWQGRPARSEVGAHPRSRSRWPGAGRSTTVGL